MSFCERASCHRSPGIAPCWRHEVSRTSLSFPPRPNLYRNFRTSRSQKRLI
jgi:hypothetical protein